MTTDKVTDKKKAGQLIRKHRKGNNFSIEQLAEKCDVSDRSISDIERGVRVPRADLLLSICRALNIDSGQLSELYPRTETNE